MLLVTFRSAGNLYGVDARRVVEIVPRVALRPIPHAPAHCVGVLSYRGRVIPVLDFSVLTGGPPACRVKHSRTRCRRRRPTPPCLDRRRVSRVRKVDYDPKANPILSPMAALHYLGDVVRMDEELVQLVVPEQLRGTGPDAALVGSSGGFG